jgi:hypothetical protein
MNTTETIDIKYIVYKYYMIIYEYIYHMNESKLLTSLNQSTYIICIGLNVIIYIFQISMNSLKNIDAVYELCQNAYYCYLEYIEQMHKTNSLHDLTNLDAILFVYKKSFDNSMVGNNNIHNPQKNIIILDDTNKQLSYIINNLSIITKSLLFFEKDIFCNVSENKYTQKFVMLEIQHIIDHSLYPYLLLLVGSTYDYTLVCEYMQYIQEKLKMEYPDYVHYLDEVHKILKKYKKESYAITREDTNGKIIDIFLNTETKKNIVNGIAQKEYKTVAKKLFIINK